MPVASGNRANPAPLVDIARHCVIPDDIAFTRYHELIAPELPGMGVTLDQWQEDIWYAALGVRDDEDRTLACDVMGVTLSIARQAGKTWGIMAGLIAICLSRPGTLVIWSSHHDRTSSETLTKIAGIVEKPAIRPKMRAQHPVVQADDNRGVHFANGSRILFGARSAGFGRGFAEVDIQVYDECQNLKESALTDMLAAMNVSDIGLAFFMGTPPRPQDVALGVHEAFKRRRDKALAPTKKRPFKGIYVEFSPESPEDVVSDIDAPGFWAKLAEANPSYSFRVGNSAIERLVENMSHEDVLRECFGIWDKTNEGLTVVSMDAWRRRVGPGPDDGTVPDSFGVAAHDGQFSVVACWGDGEDCFTEEVFAHIRLDLVADWLVQRAGRRAPVLVPNYGAAAPLEPILKARRLNARAATSGDVGRGCELLVAGCEAGWMTHADQKSLTDSAAGARKKLGRNGAAWTFDLASSVLNAPIMATTLALAGAAGRRRVTGQKRKVVVLS